MKIIQLVLLILVCHPASAMKLALWRDNNYLSINQDEETDNQDSFEYRIIPEIWVLIGNNLKIDDIATLSSVSRYFHTGICPICFQRYVGDVLKQQSEHSSQLQAICLFKGFLLARELAKITQSTKKLCEISTNDQKMKEVMVDCQQHIHNLLQKAETKRLSPLFILQNGEENFDYLKGAYEFESEDKYCLQFGHLFRDPIFLAVGHSCIVFLMIVPGICIILSNYYSQYNSLQDGILQNTTITYYQGNFNLCNNFETQFFGSCTQYNNASCYCEAIYRACENLTVGNVSSWLNWIFLNNKESNYSFISNYISNLGPNNLEIPFPTYNCSTLNNYGMLTCASGNFDHVSVYDLNLDCYIKKTIGTFSQQRNLLFLIPVGIVSGITLLIHFGAYFWY